MIPEAEIAAVRRRIMITLLASTVIVGVCTFAAFTVVNVLGEELTGGPTWSGVPGSFIVLGSAAASLPLSAHMARKGRRGGLSLGMVLGGIGAVLTAVSAGLGSFALLLAGSLLFGIGNAAMNLARYAASDVSFVDQRARSIGLVTWTFVAGAAIGPNLVGVTGRAAAALGLPTLAGPSVLAVGGFAAAAAVLFAGLRPDPLLVARAISAREPEPMEAPAGNSPISALGIPRVRLAIVAMAFGQLVMALVMSMTAVHMRIEHHALGTVGFVISAHLMGMFALAPVSGWASDRIGRIPVLLGATVVLVLATTLAWLGPGSTAVLTPALFLLGLGWSMGNVSGSALLTDAVASNQRARVQGTAESVVLAVSAGSSLFSGLIMGAVGFANLALIGAGLALVPVIFALGSRASLRAEPALAD